jgi:hypothetical protein
MTDSIYTRDWVFDQYAGIYNRALINGDLEIALKALDSISSEISNLEWLEHKKAHPESVV